MLDEGGSLLGQVVRDFSRLWPQLLTAGLIYKLVAFGVLVPIAGFALRAFIAFSGGSVIADQDILFFVLSLPGLLALVLVLAVSVGIVALEQACLMRVGFAAEGGEDVGVVEAFRFTARRAVSISSLTGRVVVKVLVLSAPFLAAGGILYLVLLTEFDINYYLSERPRAFWEAVSGGALLGALLLAVLLPRLIGWTYALPIHLFEGVEAGRALAASRERSKGHRPATALALFGWALVSIALSMLALGLVGVLGRWVFPRVQGSVSLLLLVTSGLLLLLAFLNLAIGVIRSSTLALVVSRLYRSLAPEVSPKLSEAATAGSSHRFSLRAILLGATIAAAAAALLGFSLVHDLRAEHDVIVIAHRGAAGRAPENTLASFEAAIEDGADLVELDVQESKDGVVVVLHDRDFMKIARSPLELWNAKYLEVQDLDIGSWFSKEFAAERPPTLDQVLALAKGRARLDIELKFYGHNDRLEERVVEQVEAAGMASDVVVMSLNQGMVRRMRELRPSWTVGLLTAKALGNLSKAEGDFLAVHSGMVTRQLLREAHAAGKEVYAWTVNDPIHMSRLMNRGVDGIITDEPALAKSVLAERASLSAVERLLLEIPAWLKTLPDEPGPETDAS